MRLWADVYDAAGNRLGDGPLTTIQQASVRRMLDGVGSVSLTVPAHDTRAVELLTKERRVRVFVEERQVVRELGRGIIRKLDYLASTGGWSVAASGPDGLDELKRRSVLINRAYNNAQVQAVAADLVSLVPGWTSSSSITTQLSARFDAVSVLKALQDLTKIQGLHLRQRPASNILELGAFGAANGLVLTNPARITTGMYGNHEIAFIDRITQTEDSSAVVNRLYILGAGANVDSAFTLAKSTRVTPYPIQSIAANGRTLHYIENAASIAEFGVIEKLAQYREIAPLSNNDTDEIRAANALYDAGSAWLARYSVAQTSYRVSIKKCKRLIQPGDKLRLVYNDPIPRKNQSFVPPRTIDAEFWVMSVTESAGLNGISVALDITRVDRYEKSIAQTVIGTLDKLQVQGALVQPSLNHFQAGPEQIQIDSTTGGKVQLVLTDATFSIDRVLMRIRTQPFTSTTKSAAAGGAAAATSAAGGGAVTTSAGGGNHNHRVGVLTSVVGFPATSFRPYWMRSSDGGSLIGIKLETSQALDIWTEQSSGSHAHGFSLPDHAHAFTLPSHGHDLVYGIYKDGQRPGLMTITVNGVNVTPSPIGTTGADLDTTLDITHQVVSKPGGFRSVHDVIVACTLGQGDVLVTFDIWETITPFKFGT